MPVTARGVTTVELLVALTVWGLVSGLVVGTFLTANRAARRQLDAAERREMMRATAEFAAGELRAAVPGPVLVDGAHVVYGMPQWTSITCDWPRPNPAGLELRLVRAATGGMRVPQAGRDSADVWREGYPSSPHDDRWIRGAVIVVAPGVCSDGREALTVVLTTRDGVAADLGVHPGALVAGFQMVSLRGYRGSDGAWWMGQATADHDGWHAVQPLAGPFADGGVTFGLDDAGRTATVALRTPAGDTLTTAAAVRGVTR